MLVSRQSQVCQCLACFIQWADHILLHGDKELNKSAAIDVIQALSAGVQVNNSKQFYILSISVGSHNVSQDCMHAECKENYCNSVWMK